jgi:hypothetical protein
MALRRPHDRSRRGLSTTLNEPGNAVELDFSDRPLTTQSGRHHVVSYSAENDSLEILEKIFISLFDGITFIYVAVARLIERRESMNFAV